MPVLGMGGFFWRARNPDVLSIWYKEHLGIGGGCAAEGEPEPPNEWVWQVRGGPMVFAPFKADTDYFAPDKQFMLNLRVRDLDGMLTRLNASGIRIMTNDAWDTPETGRFARIHDPEGNPIELWEPPAA
ncbi:VOC family protein [Sphingomonas sp.]|uniref:VOC family protein n=1 Tax=Sphingomonas sp. TaxID=28214 RepID=UPI002D183087|nr:VOC family protein [Sphingomonas sp.]HWK37139.1 VOC family protein [Sphingomonas sp.]